MIEVVLRIFFLFFSNTDINFSEARKLIWEFYTTLEVLPTTNRVELIEKPKFAKLALNENSEIFLVYVVVLEV